MFGQLCCGVVLVSCALAHANRDANVAFCWFILQQAGLLGENPLAALPLQHSVNMLGDLPHGTANSLTTSLY